MRASSPDDSGGNVSVGLERGKRQVRLPDVPHVDGKVHDQSRAADVFSTLGPPFHLKHFRHIAFFFFSKPSTSWLTPRGRENTPTPADSPSTAKQFLSYFKNGLFPTSFALFSSTISQCRDSNCASLVSEVTDLPIEPHPLG